MKVAKIMESVWVGRLAVLLTIALGATNGVSVANSPKSARYAVVDMQAVILNVEEGKKARADLEKEIKAKEKELLGRKQELDKMNKDWQEQSPLLSEEARKKKQMEFQQKFMALRNDEMQFQQEIKRKEQMATQKIAVSVSRFVNDLAKSRGYEMVFEANSAGLLYLKDPVDLTKEVVEKFGKASNKSKSAKK
ncbi:OmpH family outer membrane protein [Pseudobacteriovorax antillogorgiicola]|uniref:Periplasmic chaperone for outer membrane proteins Skp n=1 Tax=Pseudobacteriovorax antillogorgiicola TaxID=1513793 RepID=A0A1Y6BG16_9BACT|nr:OmpH family outer membrane protein [Pseudobacteriovorax antillogorgiicola]TCS57582.1 periplasmic chaperone for outer membrane proteins Skp [Pseudobacteriovorax antillogorgiicola]SME99599.1 periplasmic chaperone for outer membrane proteins Skp [Pseudobacteriovorax antillogorgiicola]